MIVSAHPPYTPPAVAARQSLAAGLIFPPPGSDPPAPSAFFGQ